MRMMFVIAAFVLAGCATSPGALYQTDIKKTVASSKQPAAFANCVADAFSGNSQIRNDGEHYWVMRIVLDVPRHRWDFTKTATGSKAELRSTGLAGSGEGDVKGCA